MSRILFAAKHLFVAGADEQELATPILSQCHGIFTDWSIFGTPFLLREKASSGPVLQWRQLVPCDWLWHSHGSLIQSIFDLKINRFSIYQISEKQFSRVLIGSRNLDIHCFANGEKNGASFRESFRRVFCRSRGELSVNEKEGKSRSNNNFHSWSLPWHTFKKLTFQYIPY